MIGEAQSKPPKPVIDGLLNESEIAGLHGPPEAYKTIFCLQSAESLALGVPLLGVWRVPKPRVVYFFETEMSVPALGARLVKMYRGRTLPKGVCFADETQLRQFKRAPELAEKFRLLKEWVAEAKADVVILDTCNPFFRGRRSPNEETSVGEFFDLLDTLPAPTKLFVRHNHKPREDYNSGDPATKIRGSGQFADVPDLLLELRRADKRTQGGLFSVSKFRHGSKPEDLAIWFDAEAFRLISIPPVIYLLESGPRSRPELVGLLQKRFGVGQSKADAMIGEQQPYLDQSMDGHRKVFTIEPDAATKAEWSSRLESLRGKEGISQPCETPTDTLDEAA